MDNNSRGRCVCVCSRSNCLTLLHRGRIHQLLAFSQHELSFMQIWSCAHRLACHQYYWLINTHRFRTEYKTITYCYEIWTLNHTCIYLYLSLFGSHIRIYANINMYRRMSEGLSFLHTSFVFFIQSQLKNERPVLVVLKWRHCTWAGKPKPPNPNQEV